MQYMRPAKTGGVHGKVSEHHVKVDKVHGKVYEHHVKAGGVHDNFG